MIMTFLNLDLLTAKVQDYNQEKYKILFEIEPFAGIKPMKAEIMQ